MSRGSLVEYIYETGGPRPYKCGYCKSKDTSLTQGVWGYRLTCQDFQDLIDRGFQRSGKFVYRPVMKKTCCPQYVIRMDSTKFRLSRSQRRTIKKFKQYIVEGKRSSQSTEDVVDIGDDPSEASLLSDTKSDEKAEEATSTGEVSHERRGSSSVDPPTVMELEQDASVATTVSKKKEKKPVKQGVGPDPNKPPCRKAKFRRREHRAKKQAAQLQEEHSMNEDCSPSPATGELDQQTGVGIESETSDTNTNKEKSTVSVKESPSAATPMFEQELKELLTLPSPETETAHKFEMRLVQLNPHSPVFKETYTESYEVFKKFQMIVHKENEEECSPRHFEEFLVQTPLIHEEGSEEMPCGYGTYHQQYLLDGKIFAVGVLDIIPKGVLCEYLYYDPDYRFIAPGVYTAIQETALTQQLYRLNPQMQYYYMGFYVQSCPKMNYKSKYGASYLLCPETYQYVPLQKCIPQLLVTEYCRLAESDVPDAQEGCTDEELKTVPMFADMTAMTYGTYELLNGDTRRVVVEEYVQLVGLEVAMRLRLYIGRRVFI